MTNELENQQQFQEQQDPRTPQELAQNQVQSANTSEALHIPISKGTGLNLQQILPERQKSQGQQQLHAWDQVSTDFPLPKGYQMRHNGVYVNTGKGGWQLVCQPMGIIKRYKDMITSKEVYQIEYMDTAQSECQYLDVDSSIFSRTGVDTLLVKGLVFPSSGKNRLVDYLSSQKGLLAPLWVYPDVGWEQPSRLAIQVDTQDVNPNKTAFLGATRISRDNKKGINNGSKYNLKPSGSYEHWLKMYSKEVSGNVPLEFGVVLGLSAILVQVLKQWNPDLQNFFCHIVGQSTTGKTTVAALAVSVAGRPSTTDKGLLRTWNATQNALTIMLNGNHGVPLVLDELSMSSQKDLTSLIYQLADGSEKSRATQSATLKDSKSWNTTIISTGELKITDRVNQNDGLLVRILELEGVQFTTSAEQSERIKREVDENYGWVAPDFVSCIQQKPLDDLHKLYEQAISLANEELDDSKFKPRLANKIAIIPLVAMLANEFFGWSIVPQRLVKFIVGNTNEDWATPVGERALDVLIPYLISHQHDIKVGKGDADVTSHLIGSMRLEDGNIIINILKQELMDIFKQLGFQDTATILSQWESDGTLKSERDRKTRRVEINGKRQTTYPICISKIYLDQFYKLKTSTTDPEDLFNDINFGKQSEEKHNGK
ncbi:hypothetical protein AWA2013_00620 [Lactiplantibacillus plantarum]|uniref:DUF927 domain-containing protein n=1 Tax=Lactiplantibacillus plantarum TaxID=1590 RepID=UPI002572836E|nr:DUF927 domain-containing protein [Lactiplantibacillus plantarum]BEI48656.1 hypothetical protein AWA2013_00620 [Lactiplantibacillus plantarum]